MKTILTFSVDELLETSRSLAHDVMALYPDLPSTRLLQHVLELAEPDFLAELDQMLRARHFLRVLRSERATETREQREGEWLFPEIRDAVMVLPLRIPVGAGKTVPRREICFADTGRYLKILDREQREKRRNDKRRAAVKTIRRAWPRAQRARRMTLAEVDAAKARKAGLIE